MRAQTLAFRPQCERLEAREVPSFGTGGLVSTDIAGNDYESARAVVAQADGKLVAAGPGGVARYNADGSLDTSFNAGGTQPGVVPLADTLNDVAVLSNGKILVGGSRLVKVVPKAADAVGFLLMRFNADGTPDATFGTKGAVVQTFGKTNDSDVIRSFAVQPDGKIVAAGKINGNGWGVTRFNASGTLDPSFDKDGWLTTTVVANKSARNEEVAVQADGKIVVGGTVWMGAPTYQDFAVVRYQANGALDTGFGSSGRAVIDFLPAVQAINPQATSSPDELTAMAIQGDGGIALAGASYGYQIVGLLGRLNPDGTPDPTFDGDGRAVYAPPPGAYHPALVFADIALQSDGKIVALSTTALEYNAVVRVNANGSLDNSFGEGGIATFPWAGGIQNDEGYGGVVIQPDGKIVVAGGGTDGTLVFFDLARFNDDGTLDI